MRARTRSPLSELGIFSFAVAAALGAILVLVYTGEPLLLVLAGALPLGVALFLQSAKHPLSLYATVLVLFALQARFTPELTALEAAFLVLLLGYVVGWIVTQGYNYSAASAGDALSTGVGLLIAYAGASALLGLVSGNPLATTAKDLFNFFCLFLFFPTRNLIQRDRRALTLIIVLVSFFGASAAARNLFEFATELDNAVYLWQLMQGRVVQNEMLLYAGCVFSVGGVMWFEGRGLKTLSLASASLCLSGVLLTQFRAYYVVLVLALGLFPFLVERQKRSQILKLYGILAILLGGLLVLALGPYLLAVAAGLLDRFTSIGQAASGDLSLLSRVLETQVVWNHILESPFVGHGLGFEFGFFDPNYNYTWVKSYAHNTYLSITMEMGLVGLALLLWGWLGSILQALKLARRASHPRNRLLAALVAATLAPLLLSALTSASFSTLDVFVLHAVLWGTAAGLARSDGGGA